MIRYSLFIMCIVLFSCGDDGPGYQEPYIPGSDDDPVVITPLSDEEMMDLTQKETFKYFWDFANADSGAAKERYHPNEPTLNQNVVTSGATGFGLMSIIVAIERGFITRAQGIERLNKIFRDSQTASRKILQAYYPQIIIEEVEQTLEELKE